MASTVSIKIKSELTQLQAQTLLKLSGNRPRVGLQAIKTFFQSIPNSHRAIIDVQTSGTAPVAASATWTLATVIATDVANVGKDAFTFSAGAPATENDVNVTVASAKAFASSTDINLQSGAITETTHGYLTGDVGRMTTSSVLPVGLALSTDYHVIKIDADTYALASSQANAVAGIRIYPSTTGTGNQTFTPNADKSLAFRLAQAVNAHSVCSTIVTAVAALAVVTVTAKEKGVVGNFIAFTDQDSTITSTGSGYLAGGTGGAQDAATTYTLGL